MVSGPAPLAQRNGEGDMAWIQRKGEGDFIKLSKMIAFRSLLISTPRIPTLAMLQIQKAK